MLIYILNIEMFLSILRNGTRIDVESTEEIEGATIIKTLSESLINGWFKLVPLHA